MGHAVTVAADAPSGVWDGTMVECAAAYIAGHVYRYDGRKTTATIARSWLGDVEGEHHGITLPSSHFP